MNKPNYSGLCSFSYTNLPVTPQVHQMLCPPATKDSYIPPLPLLAMSCNSNLPTSQTPTTGKSMAIPSSFHIPNIPISSMIAMKQTSDLDTSVSCMQIFSSLPVVSKVVPQNILYSSIPTSFVLPTSSPQQDTNLFQNNNQPEVIIERGKSSLEDKFSNISALLSSHATSASSSRLRNETSALYIQWLELLQKQNGEKERLERELMTNISANASNFDLQQQPIIPVHNMIMTNCKKAIAKQAVPTQDLCHNLNEAKQFIRLPNRGDRFLEIGRPGKVYERRTPAIRKRYHMNKKESLMIKSLMAQASKLKQEQSKIKAQRIASHTNNPLQSTQDEEEELTIIDGDEPMPKLVPEMDSTHREIEQLHTTRGNNMFRNEQRYKNVNLSHGDKPVFSTGQNMFRAFPLLPAPIVHQMLDDILRVTSI